MNRVQWSLNYLDVMVGVLGEIRSLIFGAFEVLQNTLAVGSATIEAI